MQRYHDTTRDPLTIRSIEHEKERERLAQLSEAFLAQGGKIQQVGHQMKERYGNFNGQKKSPVYAHLVAQPEAEPLRAKPLPQPNIVPAEPEVAAPVEQTHEEQPVEHLVVEKSRRPGLTSQYLAARLMAKAALGAAPGSAAKAIGITEKHARQLARDFRITFKRQR
ncbi:hypothetical protein [Stutzerimonas nitrititolerans]|uniref:hypothetical protein n=1 Tax=Stutzerimonas nitrititolerans TaxID=2482751 RepID=UPI0028B1AF07|nr:hypothetical protein [Stutzerimonas nitrititolerans]